jgi:hypothetical protein
MKWKPVQQLMSMKSSSEVLQGLYSVHTMHSTYNWFRVQQGGGGRGQTPHPQYSPNHQLTNTIKNIL